MMLLALGLLGSPAVHVESTVNPIAEEDVSAEERETQLHRSTALKRNRARRTQAAPPLFARSRTVSHSYRDARLLQHPRPPLLDPQPLFQVFRI